MVRLCGSDVDYYNISSHTFISDLSYKNNKNMVEKLARMSLDVCLVINLCLKGKKKIINFCSFPIAEIGLFVFVD